MKHRALVAVALFAFAVGCGKSGGGGGSNTSWETCTSDRDCVTGETCVDRRCVAATDASSMSGSGGSGGSTEGSGGERADASTREPISSDASTGTDSATSVDSGTQVDSGTPAITVTEVVLGERHTCVRLSNGSVKCWGGNLSGQLGYGNTKNIGDDELPSSVGYVSLTQGAANRVKALAAGRAHTCAILDDYSVKCWGENTVGQLGYGNTKNIGDDELPSSVGPVSVTATPGVYVKGLQAGWSHTCALLSDGTVKCWGQFGDQGGVGYGNTEAIGDDELPSSVGTISFSNDSGVFATDIFGGAFHVCARLSTGKITCWGRGTFGELGYGNLESIGDDELPSSVGPVSVTSYPTVTVANGSGGNSDTCVRLSDGTVKCWGSGGTFFPSIGLGYGNSNVLGDDEVPSSYGSLILTKVPLVTVQDVAGGFAHRYALLTDGSVVSWGSNDHGQLGYGHKNVIGDDELPSAAGPVSLGTPRGVTATLLGVGNSNYHSCVVLSDGTVKCWGYGEDGELGNAHTYDVGDDELPSAVGSVVLF